ncbi:MAG: hypothetical protein AAF337_11580 [Pseudomonadota bacterium]
MKGSTVAFLLEFGLFFGGVLAFAIWQLRSLKKLDEADAAKAEQAKEEQNQSS